jgi:UDP-N-acetylmuramoyl-L-alanyl-D-glutamate--2,6-diaminopimelate ligase
MNADDAYGEGWLKELINKRSVFAYSLNPAIDLPAHMPLTLAANIVLSMDGVSADIDSPWGAGHLTSPLIGRFNLSNSLAVLTALCVYGISFKQALELVSQLKPVAGRMQTLGGKRQPLVVVDYAHTPDALENALRALRVHTKGKLYCVFGCGGDRDAGKRPLMAKIAEELADKIIVTNDNPRSEDPDTIAKQIMAGFTKIEQVIKELDRSKAIEKSIQLASEEDCILVAGKGAETYQQIGDQRYPFDDVKEVQICLERRNLNATVAE